jgi:hypothetical protein
MQGGSRDVGRRRGAGAARGGGWLAIGLLLTAGSFGAARARIEASGPGPEGGIEPRGSAAITGSIQFSDVAPLSDFDYRSNNDFTGRKYFPQPMCGGIAILDFDGDGRQDIFFTNGAKLPELRKTDRSFYGCLLRNRGDRRFEDVTEKAGLTGAHLDFSFGVAAGDSDGDGDTDLFVCDAGPNALYRNNGDGTFTDVTSGSGLDRKPKGLLSVAAAWLDYDRDGRLDLVVSQYTYWSPETDQPCLMPDGATSFYCSPTSVVSVPHTLYRNLGGGKFQDVSAESGFASARGKGMGVAIADFNGDGWPDVFIANDTEPNFLFINKGNGRFEEMSLLYGVAYNTTGARVSAMGCDARDFNNDGWPDIFYNNLRNQIHALFANQGGEFFDYVSPFARVAGQSRSFSGWSNGFIDYDNDGFRDIYSANGDVDYLGDNSAQHDTMLRNVDGETFEDVSRSLGEDFLRVGYQRGSAFVDLDGNGFLDIVVTSLNRKPRILMSSGGNGNHWLLLALRGSKSSRDAIGARVELKLASGRRLYGHVSPSVGFMSSSDRRLHFGLGKEQEVRSIQIEWPSGLVQTLSDVRADQTLEVAEPR